MLLGAGDDVVDPQQQNRRFDGGFQDLSLDGEGFPDAVLVHVDDDALFPVDAPRGVAGGGVFGPQRRQRADGVGAAILNQRGGDDFESFSHGFVRPLMDALHALGLVGDDLSERHFGGATTRHQRRFHANVTHNGHGVLQVALDFVENVLGRAAQQDGASFGVFAFEEEGEIFVADFLDLEESGVGADVFLFEFVDAIDDGGAGNAGDAVVVGLLGPSQRSDAGFDQIVLSQVGDSFFCDDDVGFKLEWRETGI